MTKSRGILAPRAVWTDEQLALLHKFYPNFSTQDVAYMVGHSLQTTYRKANTLGLKKSAAFLASGAAGRLDGERGGACRFVKGQVSWNKGLKGVNMGESATRFKPGQAPTNTLPIGSMKFDRTGTLMRKVSDAKGNNSKRWRAVHELVWVEANGPVSAKHIVVFKPGMKSGVPEEITVDRVECISLAENMQRNTRHRYPKEIANLIALKGALTRQINKRTKNESAQNN